MQPYFLALMKSVFILVFPPMVIPSTFVSVDLTISRSLYRLRLPSSFRLRPHPPFLPLLHFRCSSMQLCLHARGNGGGFLVELVLQILIFESFLLAKNLCDCGDSVHA